MHFSIDAKLPSSVAHSCTFGSSVQGPQITISELIYCEHFPLPCHLSQNVAHPPIGILLLSFNKYCQPPDAFLLHFFSCCFLKVSELPLSLLLSFCSVLCYRFIFPFMLESFNVLLFPFENCPEDLTCHVNRPMDEKKNPSESELKST